MVALKPIRIGLQQAKSRATESPVPDHIPALDGVRGLAILLVTIYRFGTSPLENASADDLVSRAASFGFRGVDLFFVLSGFLITGILVRAKDQPRYFRNFYMRRSLRIFPLYYGAILLFLVFAPWISTTAAIIFGDARNHQVWLWFYGTNLFQSQTGTWPFGCFNHFWSLAVEEHFYLVWPLVIYLTKQRSAVFACLVVIASSCVARVGWLAAGGNDVAPEVLTFFRADALAMGALVAILAHQRGSVSSLVPLARLGTCLLGIVLIFVLITNKRLLTIPDSLFAAFFACVLVTAVAASERSVVGAFWNSRWLRFFGKYSYAMYVFQYPLIPLLAPMLSVSILTSTLGSAVAARLTYIAIMTGITTAIALASWHLYEKHFLALRHFFPARAVSKR